MGSRAAVRAEHFAVVVGGGMREWTMEPSLQWHRNTENKCVGVLVGHRNDGQHYYVTSTAKIADGWQSDLQGGIITTGGSSDIFELKRAKEEGLRRLNTYLDANCTCAIYSESDDPDSPAKQVEGCLVDHA